MLILSTVTRFIRLQLTRRGDANCERYCISVAIIIHRHTYTQCRVAICDNSIVIMSSILYADTTRIWEHPYNLQVRLTRGDTVNQGLVEVYCGGQWGTVCDDGFGQTEADTICRQLGYASANRYDHLLM